ncbi:MAG: hypothetical protein F6J97_07145 [Leptolyngbya sp. SIO4C1]|nr:hypothetical protein [Leptolyngbya sp. SIO4C1]
MKVSDSGQLIFTAPKNISYNHKLTPQEQTAAESLANLIYENQRNWIPVYVVEEDLQEYRLVGNPLVLEATKLAQQDVVYCILLDESDSAVKQIEDGQSLIAKSEISFSLNKSNLDNSFPNLTPLVKNLEELNSNMNENLDLIQELLHEILPERSIKVNLESKANLLKILQEVSGIGEKTVLSIVSDILENRPFDSEPKIIAKVEKFHLKRDLSPSKLFQNLKLAFQLDLSTSDTDKNESQIENSSRKSTANKQSKLIELPGGQETAQLDKLVTLQKEYFKKLERHFLPDRKLRINQEPEDDLSLLFRQVGISKSRASKVSKEIFEARQNRKFSKQEDIIDALSEENQVLLDTILESYKLDFS